MILLTEPSTSCAGRGIDLFHCIITIDLTTISRRKIMLNVNSCAHYSILIKVQ